MTYEDAMSLLAVLPGCSQEMVDAIEDRVRDRDRLSNTCVHLRERDELLSADIAALRADKRRERERQSQPLGDDIVF